MEPLLYLSHRVPYPPDKGDKIRSFHLLRHLSRHYRVHLGTFADLEGDAAHANALRDYCTEVKVIPLSPLLARARCVTGVLRREPLTLAYYRSLTLQRWIDATVESARIGKALCFSSAMTLYLDRPEAPQFVADFCDVDSQKWAHYAQGRSWPASSIYAREARTLLSFERRMACRSSACCFVTPAEVELFARLAPESAPKLHAIGNGVDTEFFRPRTELASPYRADEVPIVFTGAMDYWPNIDAVSWFAREVMPRILGRQPRARFYVVGMKPTATVSDLAGPHVVVTGKVPDTRPYLQHARVVVAPLRIARGVQNKVLEAMAMARPVVVSAAAAQGIAAAAHTEFAVAAESHEFALRVLELTDAGAGATMGEAARRRVVRDYNWDAQLGRFGELLDRIPAGPITLAG